MHPYPHTLSIDFGASFTKIAYRSPCAVYTAPGRYDESAEVIALDAVILVPTLAIQTGSDAQPWAFGQTAAGLNPGPKMRVFNNWKAGLFNRDNSPGAASASIIAQAYFRWLRQQLLEVPNLFLNDCKVRVMVPAFNDFKDLIKVLRQCFVHAGWDDERLEFGTEPHANAIGLLSGGRNVYIRGTKTGGNIDYGTTYGINNPYIQSARHQLLPGAQSKPFRITIVDIGAFTTDIAILTFNPLVVGNSDGLQEVAQKSFALGTHSGLDEPLWVALGTRHKLSFANYNFTLREQIKAALFAGETYSVGGVVLGDMIDQTAIEQLATDFAKRIWAKAVVNNKGNNLRLGSRLDDIVPFTVKLVTF